MSSLKKPFQLKIWHVIVIAACLLVGFAMLSGALNVSMNIGGQRIAIDNNNDDIDDITGDELVNVNKLIKISVTDYFNGTDGSGTLAIYKSGSDQPTETLTISSGIATSGKTYTSGQVLNVLYNDASNSKHWETLTVPKMFASDTQGDYNYLSKTSFTIGTYTSDYLTVGATSYDDAGTYNSTTTGTTPTFDYKLSNTGDDNTGLITSRDPTTGYDWNVYLLVKLSGTGAETIGMSNGGFDGTTMIGTTQYGWIELDANSLTIWKDSLGVYKYNDATKCAGLQTTSFDLDLTGYTGTAVTMQITAYAYFDPTYLTEHNGAVQSSAVAIAEQTETITV